MHCDTENAVYPLTSLFGLLTRAGYNTGVFGKVTNDQNKVSDTIELLRAYAANRTRFFVGVGLSATHVMRPAGLCSYRAAKA